jgi:hypothetical protein
MDETIITCFEICEQNFPIVNFVIVYNY